VISQVLITYGSYQIKGGPDAFVGMIGLGAIKPNQLCLITGSSHLHCLVTPQPVSKSGMWGAYRGAPLPNSSFAEGGQSSTGRLLVWLRDLVSGNGEEDKISYKVLDEEASKIDPGSDGLVALETW
jgi:ribulose kinase